mmetsp:Transcript_19311/g.28412  ORF Transcript_19311/g.28412 Transcript_19311/m.28412 type:complete len:87 (-) Transcript_19311:168-428(-)
MSWCSFSNAHYGILSKYAMMMNKQNIMFNFMFFMEYNCVLSYSQIPKCLILHDEKVYSNMCMKGTQLFLFVETVGFHFVEFHSSNL